MRDIYLYEDCPVLINKLGITVISICCKCTLLYFRIYMNGLERSGN